MNKLSQILYAIILSVSIVILFLTYRVFNNIYIEDKSQTDQQINIMKSIILVSDEEIIRGQLNSNNDIGGETDE